MQHALQAVTAGWWLSLQEEALLDCLHLTVLTAVPYDDNNPCLMTQCLSDLVFPEGLCVPQHSAFKTAFLQEVADCSAWISPWPCVV